MRILSFDTSTEELYVALLEDGNVVAEHASSDADSVSGNAPDALPSGSAADSTNRVAVPAPEAASGVGSPAAPAQQFAKLQGLARSQKRPKAPPRQEAATSLMPLIDKAVSGAGWSKNSIDCVVVGVGPGGFTSIRTAVVTARTLAQALNVGLMPVSLFDSLAPDSDVSFGIALAANKGNVFVATYAPSAHDGSSCPPQPAGDPQLIAAEDVARAYPTVAKWFAHPAAVSALSGMDSTVSTLPKVKNIATRQAQIAWHRLSLSGIREVERLRSAFPYRDVEPLYLRSPSVTTKPTPAQADGTQNQANAPGRHR